MDEAVNLTEARFKFRNHYHQAAKRGVPFELSFEEWVMVWFQSGRFNQMGSRGPGRYVMARIGDEGPYRVGNVRIVTSGENVSESFRTGHRQYDSAEMSRRSGLRHR